MTDLVQSGSNHLSLGDLVWESAIQLDLAAGDKREAIERLTDQLTRCGAVLDRRQVLDDLFHRESRGSTALGRGVAIPHAQTQGANQPALAFGRCAQGLDFHSLDGKPVYLVFLFIAPCNRAGFHLKVLAALSRFLRNEEYRRRLIVETEVSEVLELLKQVPIH